MIVRRLSSMFLCFGVAAIFQGAFGQEAHIDSTSAWRGGFYPLPILFYTPETGSAAGAAALYLYRDSSPSASRASSATGDVIYTEKRQVIVELGGDFYFEQGMNHLLIGTSYKNFPNSFFGIGNNVSSSMRESYTSKSSIINVAMYRSIFPCIYIAPLVYLESTFITEKKESGLLASASVPGNNGGKISGAGIAANWDSRDNTFATYSGGLYQFTALFSDRTMGSDFNYTDVELDLRKFIEVLPSQVLALQTKVSLTAGTVLFQDLARFGGQNFMRGYFDGEYRDATGVGGQAEYRVPVWGRIGAVVFGGIAQVADDVSSWSTSQFKMAGGAGLRFLFNPQEHVTIRLDFGFGSNSSGVYIAAGEAF